MKLVLSQEQQELRAAVRAFLAAASPLPKAREGYDPAVYARLNGELGLAGLIVGEEYGGAGAGFADLAVALEETGAALLPGPFLATTFAAIALAGTPDKELLTGIAEGRIAAALVLPGAAIPLRDGELTGTLPQVLSGMDADVLLVPATTDGGAVLTAVTLDGPGVTRTPLETLDLTRGQARVELTAAAARVLGPLPDAAGVADRLAVALGA
ncbi:acyl-CoA dehydrogenase family protein, partial [Nonomuraea ceibae]|uniref:acyl-CoA dehydrogenase family protein n=1 Tax=Nonomuraea ceibae TaxID=1935170 RepID=UPI001C5DB464